MLRLSFGARAELLAAGKDYVLGSWTAARPTEAIFVIMVLCILESLEQHPEPNHLRFSGASAAFLTWPYCERKRETDMDARPLGGPLRGERERRNKNRESKRES